MILNRGILSCLVLLFIACALAPAANAQIVIPLTNYRESSVSVGDFNKDGIPDLAVMIPCRGRNHCTGGGLVNFYSGDGTGNFAYVVTVELKTRINGPAVVTDFYDDGNLEVVVPTVSKGLALVTSQSVKYYDVGRWISAVQFADVDGDGKLDMLLSDGSLEIYHGNGAGDFTKIGSLPGINGTFLLADFNGDGKLDVAATDSGVNVFLGTGNGTFQPAVHTDGPFTSLAAADFNRDSKLDLIAGTWESPFVTVLLGLGNGTFTPQPSYITGQYYSGMVIAGDFNRDGNSDVAVADACWVAGWPCDSNGAVTILLGNGDGTLQIPTSYDAGGRVCFGKFCPHDMFLAAADLDGNGATDLIAANQVRPDYRKACPNSLQCEGSLAILLGKGDGTFLSALVNDHFITNSSLTSAPNPSTYGQAVTFAATVTSAESGVPTGMFAFKGAHVSGHGTTQGGVATFTTTTIPAGPVSVIATYSGDSSYLTSRSGPISQTVNPAPTITTVISSPNPSQQGQTVTITATVTSAFATPKGTVTFKNGDQVLGTVNLGNGKARYQTAALPGGSTTIVATYNPALDRGTNFVASSGSIVQVVE
jgi:Bacterial Ig-like domain (group 3)/FG-GAP-like repeat